VFGQWFRTFHGAAQIWATAPQVIALRSARVLADGFVPRADTQRELGRMVHEKFAAASESATAMALQAWKTNWELALMPARLWSGLWAGTLAAAPARIAQSGLTPVRRRVTANAKRLRRRKRR